MTLASVAALVAVYFAFVNAGAVPYAKVCSKGVEAQQDRCTYWDAVTAIVLRFIVFLDDHNGTVAALAGLAVAGFTFALWASTEKLWREATDSGRLGRRTAYAALVAARAARLQAGWAERQTEIIEKQKELQRLEYYATHRPRLVVKTAFLTLDGAPSLTIANIGGMSATITDGWAALGHIDDERWFQQLGPDGSYVTADLSGKSVAAGEVIAVEFENVADVALEMIGATAGLGLSIDRLFLFGRFQYVDDRSEEFGVKRLAVFRRWWSVADRAFVRTGNPDHEYSD